MAFLQILLLVFGVLDPLDRPIDVSFNRTPLPEALASVAQAGGFEWSYNASLVDSKALVTYSGKQVTVREVLYKILGEGFVFKSTGNYLIIKKTRKQARELSGYVKDPETGKRLANATVYDRRTLRATTTDSTGFYRLRVKSRAEVVVALPGYRDTALSVVPLSERYQVVNLRVAPSDVRGRPKLNESLLVAAYKVEKFFSVSATAISEFNVPDSLHRRIQIGFLPGVGSNATLSGKVYNEFSFNALAGVSAGVKGLELAGLGNFTIKSVDGVQIAGLFNQNRGYTLGGQFAGVFNRTLDEIRGVQAAGVFNTAERSTVMAVQAAGVFNVIRKADAPVIQVAGFLNRVNGKGPVIQASGFWNSADCAAGLQVSGFVNAADSLDGVQVAGFLNFSRKGRGVQVGLINIGKDMEGVQIGLLNWMNGRFLPAINIGRRRQSAIFNQ